MDNFRRSNERESYAPAAQAQPAQAPPAQHREVPPMPPHGPYGPHGPHGRGPKKLIAGIIALVVVLAVVALAWFLINKFSATPADTKIEKDAYQAVFLTNGQVYFGHLQNTAGGYLGLNDIYYLQVQQSLQPGAGDKTATDATNSTDASKVQLVKLGNELHGPKDHMQISSQQVLFWENLKGDSKVAQAIDNYKQDQ